MSTPRRPVFRWLAYDRFRCETCHAIFTFRQAAHHAHTTPGVTRRHR